MSGDQFNFKNNGDVNANHIGNVYTNTYPVQEFETQEDKAKEVNTIPVYSSLSIVALGFLGSIADAMALLPKNMNLGIYPMIIIILALLVLAANQDVLRVMSGVNRYAKGLFDNGEKVTTKRNGKIVRMPIKAKCLAPGCDGNLDLRVDKPLGEGRLIARCRKCPEDHVYYVDQNLVAVLRNMH